MTHVFSSFSAIEWRSCIGACESERAMEFGAGDARLDAGADDSAMDEASSKDDATFVADCEGVISDTTGTTPKPPEPPLRRAILPHNDGLLLASAQTGGGADKHEGVKRLGVHGQASAEMHSRMRPRLDNFIDQEGSLCFPSATFSYPKRSPEDPPKTVGPASV
jgi:hypothetical protein